MIGLLLWKTLKKLKWHLPQGKNSVWVGEGEKQLRNVIRVFIENHGIEDYSSRKAYIANNKKPNFQTSQMKRMEKFRQETEFRLIIQNTIKIDWFNSIWFGCSEDIYFLECRDILVWCWISPWIRCQAVINFKLFTQGARNRTSFSNTGLNFW